VSRRKPETMPGGAPLKKPRKARKPRAPKEPKEPKAKKPRAKKPCKYGPRTDAGLCPKKPKAPKKERAVRQLKSASAAGEQLGQVLRSKTATSSQKKEAAKVLATAVATESAKAVGSSVYRETKKAARTPAGRAALAKAKKGAIAVAAAAGKRVIPLAVGTAVIAAAAKGIENEKRKGARAAAERELKLTEQRLGHKLSPEQKATLRKQYEEFFYKQPVNNPYTGK